MMVQTSQKSNPIPYEGAKIVTRENRLSRPAPSADSKGTP